MNIRLLPIGGKTAAQVTGAKIGDAADALDILAKCGYQGADAVILHESELAPAFFDLSTGMAGEVLQKFSNYRMQLAIVGNFEKYTSSSLNDFIVESNRLGRILFLSTIDEAQAALAR